MCSVNHLIYLATSWAWGVSPWPLRHKSLSCRDRISTSSHKPKISALCIPGSPSATCGQGNKRSYKVPTVCSFKTLTLNHDMMHQLKRWPSFGKVILYVTLKYHSAGHPLCHVLYCTVLYRKPATTGTAILRTMTKGTPCTIIH